MYKLIKMRVIKILFNNKEYKIQKDKLMYVLEKLNCTPVKEFEIDDLMKKFKLYDEWFLGNVNYL